MTKFSNELVNLNLTINTGVGCKIERTSRFLKGPGEFYRFHTTLKLHFNPWLGGMVEYIYIEFNVPLDTI